MHKACVAVFAVLVLVFGGIAHAQRVERAYVGTDGLVHIKSAHRPEFVAGREQNPVVDNGPGSNQQSVEPVQVASDGRTVAWLVNFGNCCTSYPIPLEIVVYRDGRIIRRVTAIDGPPTIWDWHFVAGGKQLALYADTLHGTQQPACELHDVSSGKLIEQWTGKADAPHPAWVKTLKGKCDVSNENPQ